MPVRPEARLRVAICGGGIGGLILALILGRFAAASEVEIDIFESAPSLSQVGAGITMWPRSWRLMRELGLDEELGARMRTPPQEVPEASFVFRRSDGGKDGYNFHETISPFGSITIHRGEFAVVLARHLPKGVRVHNSKRLRSYTHLHLNADGEIASDGSGDGRRIVRLSFEDGTTHDADLLVGADGVKSATRRTMYSGFAERAQAQAGKIIRPDSVITPSSSSTAAGSGVHTPDSAVSSPGDGVLPLPAHNVDEYFAADPPSADGDIFNPHPFPPASFVPAQPSVIHAIPPRSRSNDPTVHDMTKQQLLTFVNPVWSGTHCYRTLINTDVQLASIPPDHPSRTLPMMYLGKDKHLISFPILQGKCINFVGMVSRPIDLEDLQPHPRPWTDNASKEEFQHEFAHFESEVAPLVSCVGEVSRWSIHVVRPLPTWIDGNVVLLGDAAHAMCTHLGAGAGQAIEDAYVLGRLLADSRTTRDTLHTALHVYESVRRPWMRDVARLSYRTGLLYQFNTGPGEAFYGGAGLGIASASPSPFPAVQKPSPTSPAGERGLDSDEDAVLRAHSRAIDDMWEWQWTGSPVDHWKAAHALFSSELGGASTAF